MLAGIEVIGNETDGLLTGRIHIADIPPGPREAEFVELLDKDRQGLPGPV
jgi:hypothetical protein